MRILWLLALVVGTIATKLDIIEIGEILQLVHTIPHSSQCEEQRLKMVELQKQWLPFESKLIRMMRQLKGYTDYEAPEEVLRPFNQFQTGISLASYLPTSKPSNQKSNIPFKFKRLFGKHVNLSDIFFLFFCKVYQIWSTNVRNCHFSKIKKRKAALSGKIRTTKNQNLRKPI